MNPMTNIKNVLKLSENELKYGSKTSWHDMYKDSAWIFIGGLPYDLTEGDVIAVFSQYGEIVNINLIRDKITGKSKGFGFICYEDQRSTILAVDNLNSIKILGRTIRVDHVENYKIPKENDKQDEETKRLHSEGCAPKAQLPVESIKQERTETYNNNSGGFRLPERLPIREYVKPEPKSEPREINIKVKKEKKSKKPKKEKKSKKSKKEKRSKKKRRRHSTSSSESGSESSSSSESETESSESEDDRRKKRR